MLYFFYGENTYLLKKKIGQLRERFIREQGDTDISDAKGENLDRASFSNLVFAVPFFSKKRLVIIRNLLLENKDDELKKYISKNLDKIPETTVLIFIEMGNPDNRTSLFKHLNQPKIAIKFDPLIGTKLSRWIMEVAEENGGSISLETANNLQIATGSDLNRLENEIIKLVLYQKSKQSDEITVSDIEKLIDPVVNPNIFDFISALAVGDNQKSSKILIDLQKSGENDLKILSMIVYQFRTMLIVSDLMNKGLNPSQIANTTKIHPFVVKKTTDLLKDYNQEKLRKSFYMIQKSDNQIKSGQIDSRLSLNLLVANLNNHFCTV